MTTTQTWSIRPGGRDDLPLLRRMIYEALYWRPDAERQPFDFVLAHPEIARYVHGWGRAGDRALVAVTEPDEQAVGAAWCRLFPADRPGYGYVDSTIPELSMAVDAGYRGLGIGRALLQTLCEQTRESGVRSLSLSVEAENLRALALYRHMGFQQVAADENAVTMLVNLDERP